MSSPTDSVPTAPNMPVAAVSKELYSDKMLDVERELLSFMFYCVDLKNNVYRTKQEQIVGRIDRLRTLKKLIDELLALPDEKGKVDTSKSPKMVELLELIKKYDQTANEMENQAKELNDKAQKLETEAKTTQAGDPKKANTLIKQAEAYRSEAKDITLAAKEMRDILSTAQALLKKTSFTLEERNQIIQSIRSTTDMIDAIQKSASVEANQLKNESDEIRVLTKSLMETLKNVFNDICRNIKG